MKKDNGLNDDGCDSKNTIPAHLRVSILSNSKRIMNDFPRKINSCYNNIVYYTNTDSLYIERKYWNVLNKTKLVGSGLCQGKNDYGPEKIIPMVCF